MSLADLGVADEFIPIRVPLFVHYFFWENSQYAYVIPGAPEGPVNPVALYIRY